MREQLFSRPLPSLPLVSSLTFSIHHSWGNSNGTPAAWVRIAMSPDSETEKFFFNAAALLWNCQLFFFWIIEIMKKKISIQKINCTKNPWFRSLHVEGARQVPNLISLGVTEDCIAYTGRYTKNRNTKYMKHSIKKKLKVYIHILYFANFAYVVLYFFLHWSELGLIPFDWDFIVLYFF